MIEICCGSFEDAMAAYEKGAKRIELNCALTLGGLTPSLGSLIMVKQHTDLEVMTMVRARGGDFCYSALEFEQMVEDAKLFCAYGSDGIVFGFLKQDGTLNEARTKEFVEIAHSEARKAIFHRAFDEAKNPQETIEQLIDLGVDRILTSGQKETAKEGVPLLKRLQDSYGRRIEILPGAGITKENAGEIIRETGVNQVHGSRLELLETV